MRTPVRRFLLGVVLLLVGLAAYLVGEYLYTRHHLQAGEAALLRRDFTAADDHLARCLRIWPKEPGLHLLAARSARRQEDFARAEKHLTAYGKARGPAPARHLEERLMRVQRGDLREAQALSAFCADHPDHDETALVLEALIAGTLRHFEASFVVGAIPVGPSLAVVADAGKLLEHLSRLREGEADRTQQLAWRGRLALLAGDLPRAQEDLAEALQRDPDLFEARLRLAYALLLHSPAEAIEHLQILRERRPSDRSVRLALANGLRGVGRLDEAEAVADGLLADEPGLVAALVLRGRIALDLRRPADALRDLRRAAELGPEEVAPHEALADYYRTAGRPDEAKRHQEKARSIQARRAQK